MSNGETSAHRLTTVDLADENRSTAVQTQPMDDIPLLIDFAAPSSIFREHNRISMLPIIGNGPPGTFVHFPNGLRISLPTDQIVFAEDGSGHACVGFGGMQFVGSEEGQLVFVRIRELLLEHQLSPGRSHTMRLDSQRVARVLVDGRPAWTSGSGAMLT
jgi:hypothetical protein